MSDAYSIKELGAQAYIRWLSFTLILSALSIAGLISTISRPDSHPVVLAFSVSWIISFAVPAVTRDAFLKVDPKRFHFARWEREGRVYGRVGITAYCWLLLHTPLGWLAPTLKLSSHRSGFDRLLREMNFAEGAHLIGGALTLGFTLGYAATGHTAVGLSFAILTMLMHAYPVMLQRWNRGRILRLMSRMVALSQSARQGPCAFVGDRVAKAPEIAEPGDSPNGGPATPFGNSAVTDGPPSVN
jgi:hypothetical protein